jgi:hypothetical protein
MSEQSVLSPSEAVAIVDAWIERFGLGALPRVQVDALADGRWCVQWEHMKVHIPPLSRHAWIAWVEDNIGALDAAALETTES